MDIYKEALNKFEELKQTLPKEELDKFAKQIIENSGDTSILYDVAAGVDPTNSMSFDAAKINKGNHIKHRVIQDTSSFAAGTFADTLLTAGGAVLANVALRKRFPELANKLSENKESVGATAIGAGVISGAMEGFATDTIYRKSLKDKENKQEEIKNVVSKLASYLDN